MITVSSDIQSRKLSISSQIGKAVMQEIEPSVLGGLFVSQIPSVTVSDPALATQINNTGWVVMANTVNDINNPFIISDGVEFTLPIRNDSGINGQSNAILNALIDNSTNKITVGNLNDSFLMRVEFNLKTVLSGRKGSFDFDIGLPVRFNYTNFKGAEDAANTERVSFIVPFYQLGTFQANGALIKGTLDGDGEIYDIICTIFKLRHGKNI